MGVAPPFHTYPGGTAECDMELMRHAIGEALSALRQVAPIPAAGAVVGRDGIVFATCESFAEIGRTDPILLKVHS